MKHKFAAFWDKLVYYSPYIPIIGVCIMAWTFFDDADNFYVIDEGEEQMLLAGCINAVALFLIIYFI